MCKSELLYTTDDDGVHLVCDEHGNIKVGFFLTLDEFVSAWSEHLTQTGNPAKEFICVNDETYNCGTVTQRTFKHGEPDWVHTGEPNAPKMKGRPFCDPDGREIATPSTMEIQ